MIGHLRGRLLRKAPGEILLDVGGVGYRLAIPLSTFYRVGEEGDALEIEVHTHVRDDALLLFGFSTRRERRLFERLIGVAGVGPRLACAILSGMPPEDLVPAIRARDVARLATIPGIGRRTAERLVVELHEKLVDLVEDEPRARPAAEGSEEAVSALVNLGYAEREARRAVQEVAGEPGGSLEAVLRDALRRLAR